MYKVRVDNPTNVKYPDKKKRATILVFQSKLQLHHEHCNTNSYHMCRHTHTHTHRGEKSKINKATACKHYWKGVYVGQKKIHRHKCQCSNSETFCLTSFTILTSGIQWLRCFLSKTVWDIVSPVVDFEEKIQTSI